MTEKYKAGPNGQKWENFIFIADYKKSTIDLPMIISKLTFDMFEGGSTWAKNWNDICKMIEKTCGKNESKIGFLRISCHGNTGIFAVGNSVFTVSNSKMWIPAVAKISKFFVPGVSFVTIDACRTGADAEILKLFSRALGGVSVRGYEQNQTENSSSEDGRGPFVTCRTHICEWSSGYEGS